MTFPTDKAYYVNLATTNPRYICRWEADEFVVEEGDNMDIDLEPILGAGYYYSEVRLRFDGELLVGISFSNMP